MIKDFNKDAEGIDFSGYDVCICGSGAAGITLALKLAEQDKKVLLLEGGDKDFTQRSQDLYKGKSVGITYYLDIWRLRFFGGTTNHWAGRCRPFVKEDFYEREINGLPGWPISFEDMQQYLPETKKILGLPAENTFKALPGSHIQGGRFIPDEFIVSDPVRFGKKYAKDLKNNNNITLVLNASATNITLNDSLDSVASIEVKNFEGQSRVVRSDKFVIAMGAIETPRLLLNSNSQIQTGIGNQTDMVGRCFMEHFNIHLGDFVENPDQWDGLEQMQFFVEPEYRIQNHLGSGNLCFSIVNQYKAYGRTAELKELLMKLSCKLGIAGSMQFLHQYQCLGEGSIQTMLEQFPNKNSRVRLSEERDEMGMQRVTLDWEMSDKDKSSIRRLATEMAQDFASSGLGRVKLADYIVNDDEEIITAPHAHQMGSTRMAKSAEHGVVDPNCRVFGINNLYIAGSGIFPTGGGGNPTMPLIQLTLRLADHLLGKPA